MSQLSIFDVLEPVPLPSDKIRFDSDWRWQDTETTAQLNEHGMLIERPQYHFFVKNPKNGWRGCNWADIKIHPFAVDMWAWSSSWSFDRAGGGYGIGLNRRVFAKTKTDALHFAREELRQAISGQENIEPKKFSTVMRWLEDLKIQALTPNNQSRERARL